MSEAAWQFEHTVTCKADRTFAWNFWTDVTNWERIEGQAIEWIRLDGPFATGTSGTTKAPGQPPHHWQIAECKVGHSARIEMKLDGAVFDNIMSFQSTEADETLITQRMELSGPKATTFTEGMKIFETTAPQGLTKLAKSIEAAYKS